MKNSKNHSKFNNKKTKIDGRVFDSKKEAHRYIELKQMEKDGLIKDLCCQPVYELIPEYRKGKKKCRRCCYIADFSYFDNKLGKTIVEDVKGVKTDVYKLKKKLFEFKYKELEIKEI